MVCTAPLTLGALIRSDGSFLDVLKAFVEVAEAPLLPSSPTPVLDMFGPNPGHPDWSIGGEYGADIGDDWGEQFPAAVAFPAGTFPQYFLALFVSTSFGLFQTRF